MVTAIIVALCFGGAVAFIPIFKQRHDESMKIEQLENDIAKQKALLARQTREADMLKNNPDYVATLAYDRLEMMKPGDTIIRLEAPHAGAVAAPSTTPAQ